MKPTPTTNQMEKQLQKLIDVTREKYGEEAVVVSHTVWPEDMIDEDSIGNETTISFSFDHIYGDEIWNLSSAVDSIVGGCDSGAGFGYRDLQLCRYFPGLE